MASKQQTKIITASSVLIHRLEQTQATMPRFGKKLLLFLLEFTDKRTVSADRSLFSGKLQTLAPISVNKGVP